MMGRIGLILLALMAAYAQAYTVQPLLVEPFDRDSNTGMAINADGSINVSCASGGAGAVSVATTSVNSNSLYYPLFVGSSTNSNQAVNLNSGLTFNPSSNTLATSVITASGAVTGSNLSGTNTGDLTLGAVGSTPGANGASLSGQVLTLQPADATYPGVISTTSQTIPGDKYLAGVTTMGGDLSSVETLTSSNIQGVGSYLTDSTVTSSQAAGVFNAIFQTKVNSAAQAAGQTRGALKAALNIAPASATTYAGNYRGMQFNATNSLGNITGTLSAGTMSATTSSSSTTSKQVGALVASINSGGIVQTSTGVDISSSHATGTDTVAHAAVGLRIANSSITAGGSSVSNTATGIEIKNNITATDTAPVAYAINSLSTAQSVFAGSLTAASLTTGGALSVSGKASFGGTAPVVSACGTTPSIVGNDVVGRVTVGTGGVATTCTVTFSAAWTNPPICIVNNETTTLLTRASATTTVLTITSAAAFTASDTIGYHCFGYI